MRVLLLFLFLGLAGLTACHHPPTPAPKGEAAFNIIPPAQASKEPKPDEEYAVPAEPILPLAAPVYPKGALASPKGAVTVGVRVNIDRTGRVTGIEPSLAVFSTPNSYDSGFREAVETAVRQWRFLPAKLQSFSVVKDREGKDAVLVRDGDKIEWPIDVAFTFSASGDVLAGVPTQGRHDRPKASSGN